MNDNDLNNLNNIPTDNQKDTFNQIPSPQQPPQNPQSVIEQQMQQPVNNPVPSPQPTYTPPINNEPPQPTINISKFIIIGIVAIVVIGGIVLGVNALLGNKDNSNKNINNNENNKSESEKIDGMQPLEALIKTSESPAKANTIYSEYSAIRLFAENVQTAISDKGVKNVEIKDLTDEAAMPQEVKQIFADNSIKSMSRFEDGKKYSAKIDFNGTLYVYVDGVLFTPVEGGFMAVQEWRRTVIENDQ